MRHSIIAGLLGSTLLLGGCSTFMENYHRAETERLDAIAAQQHNHDMLYMAASEGNPRALFIIREDNAARARCRYEASAAASRPIEGNLLWQNIQGASTFNYLQQECLEAAAAQINATPTPP